MGVCISVFKKHKHGEDARVDGQATMQVSAPTGENKPLSKTHHGHSSFKEFKEFLHRLGKQSILKHLVRHPHHHPFNLATEHFGLDGSFKTVKVLGRGGTGAAWLCKDKTHGGQLVAIKLQERPISKVLATMAYNEIVFQGTFAEGCVWLTPILETALTPTHQAQIMEFEGGGTMAEYVASKVDTISQSELVTSEDEARYFFRQLVAGVAYMHARQTAHRDIKLDNCLISGGLHPGDPPILKLADFQFVFSLLKSPKSNQHLGTPTRLYPNERHEYDPMVADVWTCGIWLVAVLVGAFPFDHSPTAETIEAEKEIYNAQSSRSWKETSFVRPYVPRMSPMLVDLLDRVLDTSPSKRATIHQVANHPWLTTPLPAELELAWRKMEEEQQARTQRLVAMHINQGMIEERNKAVWEMCLAATAPFDKGELEHPAPKNEVTLQFVDLKTIPDGWRIDMRLDAVSDVHTSD